MATIMRTVSEPMGLRLKLVVALSSMAVSSLGYSGDWDFSPKIEVKEDYTTNLNLTDDNEKSSFITQILPGFTLNKQGGGLDVNLSYNLQQVEYSSSQGNDTLNHQLSAAATAELVDNAFFVDLSSSMSQQLLSNRSASNGTDVNAAGNLTQTNTYEISPYWQQRIGDDSEAGARFTYNEVNFDSDSANDSDGYEVNLFLESDPSASRFHWGLSADKTRATPDNADTEESEELKATLGYRHSAQLDTSISYGYVDNHLNNATDSDAEAGDFWGVSLQWNPTRRTRISASYNSRLQTSNDYGFSLYHRTRHGSWTVNYTEGVSSTREQLLSLIQTGSLVCDNTGSNCQLVEELNPVLQPNEVVFGIYQPVASLNDNRFISKELTSNLVIAKGKSTYNLGIFNREREYQSGGLASEEDYGVSLGWTLRLGTTRTAKLSYDWSKLEPNGLAEDTVNTLRLRYDQQLSPKTTVVASVSLSDRDSDDATREFSEESLGVSLLHTF